MKPNCFHANERKVRNKYFDKRERVIVITRISCTREKNKFAIWRTGPNTTEDVRKTFSVYLIFQFHKKVD